MNTDDVSTNCITVMAQSIDNKYSVMKNSGYDGNCAIAFTECRVSIHKTSALSLTCLQNARKMNVLLQLSMASKWKVYHFDWVA